MSEAKQKISVMLAEDIALVRNGIMAYLNMFGPDMEIIGQAENGQKLIDLVKEKEPEIILLDLEMPVKNGIDTLKVLVKQHPKVKVIILSTHYATNISAELIALGARAYLNKACEPGEMMTTIREVHKNGYLFNKEVSGRVVKRLIKQLEVEELIGKKTLSAREIQVIKLICEGKTYKEVAELMCISRDTVKFHQVRIYRKIHVSSQVELIKYAIRIGVTSVF